ncbi:pentapeptide repeat-containing protein [Embleya sp. NPDC020886]|uniref:pentapeptide repeat-containing protein n=1 Tax=Embleya sp. NPDC020886 TaxID=3363980 RepID=UPI0037A9D831
MKLRGWDRRVWIGVAGGTAAVAVVAVVWGAAVLHAVVPMSRPEWDRLDAGTRAQAEGQFRLALIQGLAALGAGFALFYTARNFRLNRRGQVTERFTNALERLGSDHRYVRSGGVFALEQIVQDAPEQTDHVVRILVAFLRDRAPAVGATGAPDHPDPDVQTALTTLTLIRPTGSLVDLSGLHLRGAHLAGVDLRGVDLRGVDLAGVDLRGMDLRGVNLIGADLRGTNLSSANLASANLTKARLSEAQLSHAFLARANLTRANLFSATVIGASLIEADLSGAMLIGADLSGANLWDANLTDAFLLTANLSGANLLDALLVSANLSNANLSGANLTDADLTHAVLFGADLRNVNLRNANLTDTRPMPRSTTTAPEPASTPLISAI